MRRQLPRLEIGAIIQDRRRCRIDKILPALARLMWNLIRNRAHNRTQLSGTVKVMSSIKNRLYPRDNGKEHSHTASR